MTPREKAESWTSSHTIVAPGGNLAEIAAANPSAAAANPAGGVANNGNPNARLRIDSGTTIDLSGSVASLPASANLVEAQLRSAELADDLPSVKTLADAFGLDDESARRRGFARNF